MAASVLPLFRAEYGRLIRRQLVLRFDVFAWLLFAQDEGVELTELGSIKDPDRLLYGLCFGAYLSHCQQTYTRPKLTRKRIERIVENLPRKKQLEIAQFIEGVRIFGRTPKEWGEGAATDGTKKK